MSTGTKRIRSERWHLSWKASVVRANTEDEQYEVRRQYSIESKWTEERRAWLRLLYKDKVIIQKNFKNHPELATSLSKSATDIKKWVKRSVGTAPRPFRPIIKAISRAKQALSDCEACTQFVTHLMRITLNERNLNRAAGDPARQLRVYKTAVIHVLDLMIIKSR